MILFYASHFRVFPLSILSFFFRLIKATINTVLFVSHISINCNREMEFIKWRSSNTRSFHFGLFYSFFSLPLVRIHGVNYIGIFSFLKKLSVLKRITLKNKSDWLEIRFRCFSRHLLKIKNSILLFYNITYCFVIWKIIFFPVYQNKIRKSKCIMCPSCNGLVIDYYFS